MTYIQDTVDRVKAMVLQAFSDNNTNIQVVNYIPYVSEGFPYASIHWTGTTKNQEYGQDRDNRVLAIEIALIVANVDSGTQNTVANEHANNLYEWTVWVEDYFAKHPTLRSDTFPTTPQYLNPLDMELSSDNGLEILGNSGVGAQVIGTRLTLTMQYIRINY